MGGKTLGVEKKDTNFVSVCTHTLSHMHTQKGLVKHSRIICQELR